MLNDDDLLNENERLRKHILALLDEHIELRKEMADLRTGAPRSPYGGTEPRQSLKLETDKLAQDIELLRESYIEQVDKSRLLLTRYSKELNEEERLVRSFSSLQNNYDKLSYKYECLASSPLGRLMIKLWSVYNKVRNDSGVRMR